MKNIKNILILLLPFLFLSCEKVIDVDLQTAEPRIVIDASIKWIKGTSGNNQKIKLTTTTDYYNSQIPTVSGAVVFITNKANKTFSFIEKPGTGDYFCTDFSPELNGEYILTVAHNGATYTATETLKAVPTIDEIEQKDNGGFTGKDIEIKAYFTDNGNTDDFYLSRFKTSFSNYPTYEVDQDKYFQGNQIFTLFTSKDLKKGQNIAISLAGISQRYYNYINVLLSIAGSNGGSPFQSPPATVRGNLINKINESNYALGYFSLSETDEKIYTIQ
jgi:hypothetical protein